MRAKRGFINHRRKLKGGLIKVLNFRNRAHKYYQTGSSIKIVTKRGHILKQEWKNPILKIVKRNFNKKSFLTLATSMSSKSTSKPIGIRMGKGKGKIDTLLSVVRRGQPLFSLSEFSELNLQKLYTTLKGRTSYKAGLKSINFYF